MQISPGFSNNTPAGLMQIDTWRIFRIMSEFVEGFETMGQIGPAVSIFGSARTPESDPYYIQARDLSRMLSQRGFSIITGGGPGIMEAANRGAHDVGGLSVGLNITLPHEQSANPYAKIRMDFHYFFARMVMFVKYACSFVCFPGGFGTLHEFFNSMTLIQTGKSERFPVILIGKEFWSGMDKWIRSELLSKHEYHKISPEDMDLFVITDSIQEAAEIIQQANMNQLAAPQPAITRTGEGTVMGFPAQEYAKADDGHPHIKPAKPAKADKANVPAKKKASRPADKKGQGKKRPAGTK
jgi:uncharacterized protein (TIGR00730 family)